MKNEIIEVIAEQLANEFILYEGNIYEVATRIYNIMKLEEPKEVLVEELVEGEGKGKMFGIKNGIF